MTALFALASGLGGCSTLGYLFQASKGQMQLFNRARPIEEVLQNERTPSRIRQLLARIPDVKAFGESMGLKPTRNYTEYVQLDRPYAVYVVSACEPLEFKPREWKFPIVGSFPYLGWFSIEGARGYAKELSAEGLDVDVRGASAYSTLGWFRDAVLSSMIPPGEEALGDLVDVVLHESVHATLYINGQSSFNESLASFVADRLTPAYLDRALGPDSSVARAYLASQKAGEKSQRRLHEVYLELEKLYASAKGRDEKLAEKKRVLEALKQELGFKRDLNNAALIQFRTYHTNPEGFAEVLKACGGDVRRFMRVLGRLDEKSFPRPQTEELNPVLRAAVAGGCP